MRALLKHLLLPSGTKRRRIRFGPAAGLSIEVDPQQDVRLWLGLLEAELHPHFHRLAYPGARCFDIGAAEGYHAIMLAKLSGQPVLAFEPANVWVEKTRDELASNGLSGEVMQVLVGAQVADGMISIDQAAQDRFVPDFIKMDIEGAEVDALTGAEHVLANRKPHLIIETHGAALEQQCIAILKRHGYAPTVVHPRTWLAEYRPMAHNRWLVCEGRPG